MLASSRLSPIARHDRCSSRPLRLHRQLYPCDGLSSKAAMMAAASSSPSLSEEQRAKLLLLAALDGDVGLLKRMARSLDKGQGVAKVAAAVRLDGALHLAADCGEGRLGVFKYLIEELHMDVNLPDHIGGTPLLHAAFHGRTDAARYLLDHGADLAIAESGGFTPLHWAAENGHCDTAVLLLSRGASVDPSSLSGTPLHVAAANGQAGTMKILLEHNADPNNVISIGCTPLGNAISAKSLNCVKLLIEAGADVNFINSIGVTPVMVAVEACSTEILKCLLEAGAEPNVQDDFARLPIEVAAFEDRREDVEMLFPSTSPIPEVPDWSIDGIISHVKFYGLRTMDKRLGKKKRAEFTLQGGAAFEKKDYIKAAKFYTCAMDISPRGDDATLLAKRCLCWLVLDDGERALSDANMCRIQRPCWWKACYQQGAAFMLLEDYAQAYQAFSDALRLDPGKIKIQNALREADEAMKAHGANKKRRVTY